MSSRQRTGREEEAKSLLPVRGNVTLVADAYDGSSPDCEVKRRVEVESVLSRRCAIWLLLSRFVLRIGVLDVVRCLWNQREQMKACLNTDRERVDKTKRPNVDVSAIGEELCLRNP